MSPVRKKYLIFCLISILLLFGGFFLVSWQENPANFQFQEFLNQDIQEEIIIIFNSGGWGNTPLEKAEDFAPIIKGIQEQLREWGYNSVVLPHKRTKDSFFGKIAAVKDFLNSFKFSAEDLAEKAEDLAKKFPDKKIIITGLSAGGGLVNETMEKISNEVKNSIYGISAGAPFWVGNPESENLLRLDNSGKDSVSIGKIKSLLLAFFKGPFKWISSKITGQNLPLALAFHAPGHDYFWSSPEVGPPIIRFLENKFAN